MPVACWGSFPRDASSAPAAPLRSWWTFRRSWSSPDSISASTDATARADMGEPVTVPLWLFLAISVFAAWALLDRLLIPSVRWVVRRRLNRLIDRVNRRLAVEIKPFQLTKRQVLIDRLVYDPLVVAAANDYARANTLPRQVALDAL